MGFKWFIDSLFVQLRSSTKMANTLLAYNYLGRFYFFFFRSFWIRIVFFFLSFILDFLPLVGIYVDRCDFLKPESNHVLMLFSFLLSWVLLIVNLDVFQPPDLFSIPCISFLMLLYHSAFLMYCFCSHSLPHKCFI